MESNTDLNSSEPTVIQTQSSVSAFESKIITYLVENNRVFFRSQQINDPEISFVERRNIVLGVWQKGIRQLLNRFGKHLTEKHLDYFEQRQDYPPDDEYEIRFHLSDIRKRLKNRQRDVKNRRFAAMHKMIADKDCSYFEEHEMMVREPLLYDHLVGQYMTDTERKIRDNFDPNAQFSGVLLEGIERDQVKELQQKQQMEEEAQSESTNKNEYSEEEDDESNDPAEAHIDGIINEDYYPQTPPSYKKHWGDFEDDAASTATTSVPTVSSTRVPVTLPSVSALAPKRPLDDTQKYVTSSEKDLLREEFFGIMQANFLSGKDADFDYSTVDDNSDYDDVEQLNRDAEDQYFDADDYEDDGDLSISRGLQESSISDDSEDELDNYMKGIDKDK